MASARRGRQRDQSRFATINAPRVPRSVLPRSCGHRNTVDVGRLYPYFVDEILPGDTFSGKTTIFARMATPIYPIMDNLYIDSWFFFVPNRLLWNRWEEFMGDQEDPDTPIYNLEIPQAQINVTRPTGAWLTDAFGLPTGVAGLSVSALPYRAVKKIADDWFRDQNQQTRFIKGDALGDGPDIVDDAYDAVPFVNKRHDYFSAALPWPQKGPDVGIGIGGQAPLAGQQPVTGTADAPIKFSEVGQTSIARVRTGGSGTELDWRLFEETGTLGNNADISWSDPNLQADFDTGGTAYADLSAATAYNINQLRQAAALQHLYERDARSGTRYAELLRGHFGVYPEDARLQRSELISQSTQTVGIHQVEQTESTESSGVSGTPQGNLAAYGLSVQSGRGWTKSFSEHGWLIGVYRVRADLTYQQGIERQWSRKVKEEFYWPALAHLGEQAILSKELYADGTSADDDVFGYQERYAEYRYKPSRISGLFRSSSNSGLDAWHLAQEFSTRPVLNAAFIREQPPMQRIMAVTNEPAFLVDTWTQLRCVRPMPVRGTPGLSRL